MAASNRSDRPTVYVVFLVQIIVVTDAQRVEQDTISMSSDGWRPIVGTGRKPNYNDEITHYRNPSQISQTVKAQVPATSSTTAVSLLPPQPLKGSHTLTPINNLNGAPYKKHGAKIPPHAKHQQHNTFFMLPNGGHGPHIPLGASFHGRPNQHVLAKKHPTVNKPHGPPVGGKRVNKPPRVPAGAHSTPEEILVPAPSNLGLISYFKKGQNAVKTRETSGLGLLGANHFSINQPNAHIEFTHGFALPPQQDDYFGLYNNNPTQGFVFPKQTLRTDRPFKNQNDEYTRNLVPPPLYKGYQEKEKQKFKNQLKIKEAASAITETSSDLNNNEQYITKTSSIPENIIVQLPPPYNQNKLQFSNVPFKKDSAIDVHVTREKFKVYHEGIAPNYNSRTPDYVDYDYHTVQRPSDIPKLQTYEVTEGKQWQENLQTPPFHYRFPEHQQTVPKIRKPTVQRFPSVELNVPPFLPTPYRPEGIIPTSPTQSEVSTIFDNLSTKMKINGYHDYVSTIPSFFDIKEVSTHFPILGRPEITEQAQREQDVQKHEDTSPEITNEITTNKTKYKPVKYKEDEYLDPTLIPTTTTEPTTTRPTKHRRRRPLHNRTRPATTEEPVATDSYELQKTQENETEGSMETERPQRQRRPSRYRTSTQSSESEESVKVSRGRNRYRPRTSTTEASNSNQRKRIRPSYLQLPSNHKMTEADVYLNEYTQTAQPVPVEEYIHQPSTEQETQGLVETKISPQQEYIENNAQSDTITNRFQYDVPNRYNAKPQQEENISISDVTTTVVDENNNLSTQPSLEDTAEITELTNVRHRGRPTTTTEHISTTNVHIPENEIDYSTSNPKELDKEINEVTQRFVEDFTLATTLPTTTTTEVTTTKSHRIRGRPVKYDSSNRPRFSVKDYRQRLSQYSSTSTSTESYRTTSESLKLRFPNRLRKPLSTTSFPRVEEEEEVTEYHRQRFSPKSPRRGYSTTASDVDEIITEKAVRAVNTRLRPFGRQRSTTEPSTSPSTKISIKPNLFSNRRRPPQLSLRSRIQNKLNKTETIEKPSTTVEAEEEVTEVVETNLAYNEENIPDSTTEFQTKKLKETEPTNAESDAPDYIKNDAAYSERISELTSSAKNNYNTPGIFKSVSPTSRRIPNYFTMATDDPILPIEAFFPNIKDMDKNKQ